MKEFFVAEHYTLAAIPEYRQQFIALKVQQFMERLELKEGDWPLDCMVLLNRIKETPSAFVKLDYSFEVLEEEVDGVAQGPFQDGSYHIYINANNAVYPYEFSFQRRLNFTVAHELGHIILNHLLVPRELKSTEELKLEDLEADQFAGLLLMPDWLVLSCNFNNMKAAAKYFIVSRSALWKRINNIKRLDLLCARPIRTCPCCGNTKFFMFAEYCSICGTAVDFTLAGINGVRRRDYGDGIATDRYKRVLKCPLCNGQHFSGDRFSRCGTYIFNYCMDFLEKGDKGCEFTSAGNGRFCEQCGRPTYFYSRGLLKGWKEMGSDPWE